MRVAISRLKNQIRITKEGLSPEADMHDGLIRFTKLVEMFFYYLKQATPTERFYIIVYAFVSS